MKTKLITGRIRIPLLLALVFCGHQELAAQVPVDENGEPLATYDDGAYSDLGIAGAEVEDILPTTDVDLEELVGPIALYPDDLLAIVLPASTYPLEIVQAARFLTAFEADSSLLPDESWDESIVALLNYPEVVRLMDDEIDWTWQLGEAVLSQEADVIAAVEAFRDRAYAAGNLASDEYQTVSREDGVIEIEPLDDEIIYVPYYEPSKVVTYQTQPVYAYYPDPYPVYYYPYPTGHYFLHRPFWGVTTAYTIGWPNRYLNVHHSSYWGHPYYGSYYSSQYYRQPSINVYNTWYVHNSYRQPVNQHRDGDHWRPHHRTHGARPTRPNVRNDYYPPGSNDQRRVDSQSNHRSRNDTQAANRVAGERHFAAASGDTRTTAQTNGNRRSQRAAAEQTEIRFRQRSGANVIRANAETDTTRTHDSASGRQVSRARNSSGRRSYETANTGTANTGRGRTTPVAQVALASTTDRTSSNRGRTGGRHVVQGSVTRTAGSRQSSGQRTTTAPPVVQSRQVSNTRRNSNNSNASQARNAATASGSRSQGQSSSRQPAAAGREKSNSRPARQRSPSRGNSRGRRQ